MRGTLLHRLVASTLMPGFHGPDLPDWLGDRLAEGLGSVCLFGSNVVDAAQVRALTSAIHAVHPACVIAVDEEGGDVTRLHHRTGSPHPSAAYLGRLDDVALTETTAAAIGTDVRRAGIDLDLAPDADVNSNPRNPVIGVRSFGADAHLVARHVAAAVRGLQSAGVGAVPKHFPGHGDTASDSHREMPTIASGRLDLAQRELVPFEAAVAAGAVAVMTSHILVPAVDPHLPATQSAAILAMLRRDLGFDGAIVTDALDMAGASARCGIPEAAVLALAAGADLLCLGTDFTAARLDEIVDHVVGAVTDGRLQAERLEEASSRVSALSASIAALPARAVEAPAVTGGGFLVTRPVAPVRAPVLVRLLSDDNIAAGSTPWGIGDHLAVVGRLLPGAGCMDVSDLAGLALVLAAEPGRALVVQGRDLARVPFLREAAELTRSQRPDAILVELGWPVPGEDVDVATFGSGAATDAALVRLLAEGSR